MVEEADLMALFLGSVKYVTLSFRGKGILQFIGNKQMINHLRIAGQMKSVQTMFVMNKPVSRKYQGNIGPHDFAANIRPFDIYANRPVKRDGIHVVVTNSIAREKPDRKKLDSVRWYEIQDNVAPNGIDYRRKIERRAVQGFEAPERMH